MCDMVEDAERVPQVAPFPAGFCSSRSGNSRLFLARRRVLRASVAEDEGCGRALCAALWGVAVKGGGGSLAKTHAAKVVAALATCGDEKTVKGEGCMGAQPWMGRVLGIG